MRNSFKLLCTLCGILISSQAYSTDSIEQALKQSNVSRSYINYKRYEYIFFIDNKYYNQLNTDENKQFIKRINSILGEYNNKNNEYSPWLSDYSGISIEDQYRFYLLYGMVNTSDDHIVNVMYSQLKLLRTIDKEMQEKGKEKFGDVISKYLTNNKQNELEIRFLCDYKIKCFEYITEFFDEKQNSFLDEMENKLEGSNINIHNPCDFRLSSYLSKEQLGKLKTILTAMPHKGNEYKKLGYYWLLNKQNEQEELIEKLKMQLEQVNNNNSFNNK